MQKACILEEEKQEQFLEITSQLCQTSTEAHFTDMMAKLIQLAPELNNWIDYWLQRKQVFPVFWPQTT